MNYTGIIIRIGCGSIFLATVLLLHLKSYYMQGSFIGLAGTVSLFLIFSPERILTKTRKVVSLVASFILVATILTMTLWENINRTCAPEESFRNPGLKGKLLLLVPHQDDELNCLGGAMETLSKDCEIYVAYSTNGDKTRMKEAKRALSHFSIPADHIIFMGYEHAPYNTRVGHLYHTADDEPITYATQNQVTWGMPDAPCWEPGLSYTHANFNHTLKSVIQTIHPDIIVAVDFDLHSDHRALGLTTERILAQCMKQDRRYTPTLLKAFAYSTRWFQPPSFYRDNIPSVTPADDSGLMKEVNCYRWNDRLRLPVGYGSVSRSLACNTTARSMREHESQKQANTRTEERICKGDYVFWWRPTSNQALHAQVSGDGEDLSHLNDLLLYDSSDITDFGHKPYEHGWRLSGSTGTATFTWQTPQVIRQIHLFDQVDEKNQITKATICLDNGKKIPVGPLPASGERHVVETGCSEPVTGFSIKVESSMGDGAGLAEVEAYANAPAPPVHIAKLQDKDGHFMYDYIVPENGALDFSLYTWGMSQEGLQIRRHDGKGKYTDLAHGTSGSYSIHLETGEECYLEVRDGDDSILDRVLVRNPGTFKRGGIRLCRSMDSAVISISWENQKRYYRNILRWLGLYSDER